MRTEGTETRSDTRLPLLRMCGQKWMPQKSDFETNCLTNQLKSSLKSRVFATKRRMNGQCGSAHNEVDADILANGSASSFCLYLSLSVSPYILLCQSLLLSISVSLSFYLRQSTFLSLSVSSSVCVSLVLSLSVSFCLC